MLRLTSISESVPDAAVALPAQGRLVSAVAGLAGIVVATLAQPHALADEAAVALRYAGRFARGAGLTFNPGESLLGFSHPLWTFLLALFGMGGGSVELAARFFGVAAYAVTAALLVIINRRLGGNDLTGVLAAALALLLPSYRDAMLSGTGIVLTVCLGLAALDQSLRTRPIVAGILFGLAAFNGPCALALPMGLAAASWLQERALPRRLIDFTLSSWLLLLLALFLAFGSVIPAGRDSIALPFPAAASSEVSLGSWLLGNFGYCLLFLAAVRLLYLGGERTRERLGLLALAFAFAIELTARLILGGSTASSDDFATLVPSLILLGAGAPGAIARSLEPRSRPRALAAAVLLLVAALPGLGFLTARGISGRTTNAREAFELDLRSAGEWLNSGAGPDEGVGTSSAWTAFALANDVTGVVPRPADGDSEPLAYQVLWGQFVGGRKAPPVAPAGMVPLAIFDAASLEHAELPWITVFGTPESQIARRGVRAYTLHDLDPPSPLNPPLDLQRIRLEGRDLQAYPPSGARFRVPNLGHVIVVRFTPGFCPGKPTSGSNGVSFGFSEEGEVRFSTHVLPNDPARPLLLRLIAARHREETSLDFATFPGPDRNAVGDWACWLDVSIELEAGPGAAAEPVTREPELQAPDS